MTQDTCTPYDVGPNEVALRVAIDEMTSTPAQIGWLYVRAALERHKGNVTYTAKGLGMYRRSLQRMLGSRKPPSYNN
jgi:ActR/RegA family two-component response regulator